MKRTVVLLFCLSMYYALAAQRAVDVQHYHFNLELNDKNDTIYGRAEITAKAVAETSIFRFDLEFAREKSRGMMIEQAYYYNEAKKEWIRGLYSHDSDGFGMIDLPPSTKPGSIFRVAIVYKGIPADGLIISKNKYGHRTFFSDNWPNRAHHWIPCVDDPADKATVEFVITAPSHYQVISNGTQIEETNLPGDKKLTHWKEDVPLPTKVMVIGVADFAVNTVGEVNCVPVSSWVFPENKTDGFYDYAPAKDILAWYMNYIGPYAYQKLANVQSKTIFGGMENASAIFYYENSVTGKRQEESLLAHELVHQWFGNHATEKSFAHLWLSEGFATYLTHVYLEDRYGTDSLNKRMQKDREEVIDFVKQARRPVVDSTTNYMQLLNANSYQKGGWILHMLRRQLGDSIFKKSVRQYYAEYAGKNADTKDLQKIFETVSGKKLNQFFIQWLHTPANPILDIRWKYDIKTKKIAVTVTQLQPAMPFAFPLEIAVGFGSSKSQLFTLNISKQTETFSFPADNKVTTLQPDPKTSLLFEGEVKEIN